MLTGLSLRLRIFLIFAGLAGAVIAVVALALWTESRQLAGAGADRVPGLASALTSAAAITGFGVLGLMAGVWYLFDRNVARPIEALAGGLRTGHAPDAGQARYLADLGPAACDAAAARARQAEALAEAVQEHAADLAREKAVLESILSDFGAGAVMFDGAGRVVFYNAAAARLLPGLALDRPLDRFLRPGALQAAQARVAAGAAVTDLTCLTTGGAALTGRLRQIEDEQLLILRDRPASQPLPRRALEDLRRHAATLVPLLSDLDGPIPPQLAQAIRAEGQGLARATRALSDAASADQPAARASLRELGTGLAGGADLPDAQVMAEAGPVNALLRLLDGQLRDAGLDPALVLLPRDDLAAGLGLALAWRGDPLAMDALETWLAIAPDADQPDQSGADLLAAHGTGIWSEGAEGTARLVLPLMPAPEAAGDAGLTYDFALARRGGAASSALADMTCVVFDTETTGLGPDDRIVQIAGLRIARGRLTGERFETLVNPGRRIPPQSTAVHGISDQMVVDAPDMTTALGAFHHFAEGAVLIAHNAPFDMGLLRRAVPETGVHFDNRVLDTVLLSAMVYGQAAPHTLDALTQRLGIEIPPEDRHTAMGDTVATAEAFLRLIPALNARGLIRVEDVIAEARKHKRLIGDANLPAPAEGA